MTMQAGHVVAIFGGAVAGSEAAAQFSRRGIYSVVFDQGEVPWGKIESGLPKWHAKQRDQEEALIDERLSDEHVRFVPRTKLGLDISIQEVVGWGFSAVLLAVGAWKDRPLAVPGIDEFEGRGFYYQNPYVAWFNQSHDPDSEQPSMEICDGALVVGGGLASLDVVKILMLETTLAALRERGLNADLFTLEKKGIPKVLESLGVTWEDLRLRGCTLVYRRRARDMPLVPLNDEPDERRLAQVEKVREKLLDNFLSKYLFHFEPCCLPVDKVAENGRLVGLRLQRTEISDEGRVLIVPESEFEMRAPLVISSIGSIPEPIPGIPMERELYRLEDHRTCRVSGFDRVFALGNTVTGRGNIRASRVHGREVSEWVMNECLDWHPEDREMLAGLLKLPPESDTVLEFLNQKQLLPASKIRRIFERVEERQRQVGYKGDYATWLKKHRPVRLEQLKN
jgi:ferredoxin/flavodoxin---NADP+ reductase